MDHVYVIAEIGINHNGDVDIAKQLIDVADEAGCDAVKFQKRNPDACVPEEQKSKMRDTPWGRIPYIEYKKRIEFGKDEYNEIHQYCDYKGIDWTASVWDLDSAEFLRNYRLPWVKVPSPMLTNHVLLDKLKDEWEQIVVSTGMSTREEIDEALSLLSGGPEVWVAHCTSEYPCPNGHLNLRMIDTLKDEWPQYRIGYSGHEKGLQTTVAAVARGATFVERHITLDRTMWGSDQSASVEPQGLKRLVRDIRVVEDAMGDGEKKVYPGEKEKIKSLRG